MKLLDRLAWAVAGGCTAIFVYADVWPRYFGWFHWGGAGPLAPLLKDGSSPVVMMVVIGATFAWSLSSVRGGRPARYDGVQFKLQPSGRRSDRITVTLERCPPDRKIITIKLVRDLTGSGLREAKDLVDHLPGTICESVTPGQAAAIRDHLAAQGAQVTCAQVSLPGSRQGL